MAFSTMIKRTVTNLKSKENMTDVIHLMTFPQQKKKKKEE
jgi:hypothetical protein